MATRLYPIRSRRWAIFLVLVVFPDEEGPVMILIEYRIQLSEKVEFTHALHAVRPIRMRDGAIRWGVYQDTAQPERFVETFVMESWLEFLRARERMTAADRVLRDRVRSFHQGDDEPRVSRMIYAHETERPAPPANLTGK